MGVIEIEGIKELQKKLKKEKVLALLLKEML